MPHFDASSPQSNPTGSQKSESSVLQPERWVKGAWLFRDETLNRLATLLDEAFRIPFTGVRFGVNGIIGLVPGFGDVIAGTLSLIIPLAAWTRGVPYVTLVRMAANLALDVLVGSIPILGDAFDIAWKTNRRNYRLLLRDLEQPRRHTWKDWFFLAALACAVAIVFVIPIVVIIWLLMWLNRQLVI